MWVNLNNCLSYQQLLIPEIFTEDDILQIILSGDCTIGICYFGNVTPQLAVPYILCINLLNKQYISVQDSIITELNIQSYDFKLALKGQKPIIGYKYRFKKECKLESIIMDLSYPIVGTKMKLYVGEIDQRQWLITRKIYSCTVKQKGINIYGDTACLIIPDEYVVIHENESVFIDTAGQEYNYSTNIDESQYLCYLREDKLQTYERKDVNLANFKIIVRYVNANDTYFATSEEVENINTSVKALENEINNANVITDNVTGNKYKIIVVNGEIQLKNLSYKKILILGNSFTNHGKSDFWYDERGMASSVPELDYKSLLKKGIGDEANIITISNGGFETGYTEDFDFETNIPITDGDTYDAVIVQLGENSTYRDNMSKCWTNFLKYLKSKCTTADLVQVIGWSTGDKLTAILQACSAVNVSVLNCREETYTGQFFEGFYVTGETKDEFGIIKTNVKSHPSDIGMYLIANRILSYWQMIELDMMRNINLIQTEGGTITTNYEKGVVGGVISIKCVNDTGKQISSIIVNDGEIIPVKRSNEYGIFYTFFMPDKDVTINANWSDVAP